MKIVCNQDEAEMLGDACLMSECEECVLYSFCKEENDREDISQLIKIE